MRTSIDYLWTSMLESLEFDVRTQSLRIGLHMLDGGASTYYELDARNVTALVFRNSIQGPWDVAEVSEVWTTTESGSTVVEFEFWTSEATLTITATDVSVREVGRS